MIKLQTGGNWCVCVAKLLEILEVFSPLFLLVVHHSLMFAHKAAPSQIHHHHNQQDVPMAATPSSVLAVLADFP